MDGPGQEDLERTGPDEEPPRVQALQRKEKIQGGGQDGHGAQQGEAEGSWARVCGLLVDVTLIFLTARFQRHR